MNGTKIANPIIRLPPVSVNVVEFKFSVLACIVLTAVHQTIVQTTTHITVRDGAIRTVCKHDPNTTRVSLTETDHPRIVNQCFG
jgi:hypothetical protein